MEPFRDYESVRAYLYSLRHHGAKYGIERMQLLAEALGHPERRFPSVHVAGTNGKGSTSAMIEAIYRAAGYKTGLYTSPHLVHQGERIQIDRQITSRQQILELTNLLLPTVAGIAERDSACAPSFFEFMTAMAFQRFAQEKVDVGVVEVGLGGRLDATNILLPEVSVITSISLDHCDLLGNSLEKIATEKAGIIKPGRPVVLSRLPAAAERVIRQIARERQAPVFSIAEAFGDPEAVLRESEDCDYPQTRLAGPYQRWNAAAAVLAVRLLQKRLPVSETNIRQGLSTVCWAGRWDEKRLCDGRRLILDAGHNPEGAEMLELHLARLVRETGRRPVVITGSLGEERAAALFAAIARHASQIHLCRPAQPKALSYATMERLIPSSFAGVVGKIKVEEAFPAPGLCTLGGPEDILVACGSIYLLGEILTALEGDNVADGATLQ